MKRIFALFLTLALAGCSQTLQEPPPANSAAASGDKTWEDAVCIELSDTQIKVDGETASTDPTRGVFIANDIVFYPTGQDFTYGEGTDADTHTQQEADSHTVVHITQPGQYVLSGTLSAGQIAVDLGEGAEDDPDATVTLILNNVDVTCSVAPAVIFYNVYECGSTDTESASEAVDTTAAGANVFLARDSVNHITGSYVARIYKPDSVELSEDGTEVLDAKKLHKYDAAFYSKMSMNVDGASSGVLNITAENEGMDSELHLTINGGNINIASGNDGMNTNEDGVSVTTINGGSVNIVVTGETGEGDGIDSNGWLVINGGTVCAAACSDSGDAGIDSDMGIHINGGSVVACGNMLDRIETGGQNYAVFQFAQRQSGGTEITLKPAEGNDGILRNLTPANDFTYLIVSDSSLTAGDYTLWKGETQLAYSSGMVGGGFGGMMQPGGPRPPEEWEDIDLSELPQIPEDFGGHRIPAGQGIPPEMPMEPPENFELPDDVEAGRRPMMPANVEINEDGTITLPDGTTINPPAMMPSDGQGAPGFHHQSGNRGSGQSTENLREIFFITDGGNIFSGISEKN